MNKSEFISKLDGCFDLMSPKDLILFEAKMDRHEHVLKNGDIKSKMNSLFYYSSSRQEKDFVLTDWVVSYFLEREGVTISSNMVGRIIKELKLFKQNKYFSGKGTFVGFYCSIVDAGFKSYVDTRRSILNCK